MSEIRVENIIGENGLDAVNFSKGVSAAGIVTATGFKVGAGISLTDTGIKASNFYGSGAALTGISAGITMMDQWRVSAAFNSQNETITSNWERVDTDFAQIGTGMTYNSGIWTFPQTGIYHIEFCMAMYLNSSLRYMGGAIQATTDNSSYVNRADGYTAVSNFSSPGYVGRELFMIFDVTNTSTHKVRFRSDSGATVTYDGSSTSNRTYVTFTRLGDT